MNDLKIGSIFIGKESKKQELIYFLCVFIFLTIMCLLAQSTFPGGYSPLINHISNQGDALTNPGGYLYFDIGAIITGILMIPHFLYLYRHTYSDLKLLSLFGTIAGICGCIGFTLVGIIREEFGDWHSFSSNLAFGSFAACGFLFFLLYLRKIVKQDPWPTKIQFLIAFGLNVLLLVLAIVMQQLGSFASVWKIDPHWFTYPLWQWESFINVILLLFNIFLLIPSKTVPNLVSD